MRRSPAAMTTPAITPPRGRARARMHGPEPWKTVHGVGFTHWDMWFVVVVAAEPDGWDGALAKLNAKRTRHGFERDDAEAKLSHVDDLRERLARAALTPASLMAEAGADGRSIQKARANVFERTVAARDKTPAMLDTPRQRLEERALRGQWSRFPYSPSPFEIPLYMEICKRDVYEERATLGLVKRLDRMGNKEAKRIHGNASQLLALHRAMMTAILVAIERADDSCGSLGDLFSEVFDKYVEVAWEKAGIEPEVYIRDVIEFGVWEDYGLLGDLEAFFAVLDRRHAPVADAVFVEVTAELKHFDFAYQIDRTNALRAAFFVEHRRFDHFVELAAEIGSSAWKPIVSMAQAACKAAKKDLALAVFGAADKPGSHQEYLRTECRRITGRTPPSAPIPRRVTALAARAANRVEFS